MSTPPNSAPPSPTAETADPHATVHRPIAPVAETLGLSPNEWIPYGHDKAKITFAALQARSAQPDAAIVLVTATSPTPSGDGKTTTTIGLGDALRRLGRRAVISLREPSMGPVFGMKGGATGGGRAQLTPMEAINLHFTGDFAAIGQAHNLLSALIDNHLYHGNALGIDPRRITWKRVLDMNDRALRHTVVGLGGTAHGIPRETGFDIVVASEVMAIVCLATSYADLSERLGRIIVARTTDGRPVTAADLQAHGAMTALLRDALLPNLVQSLEGTPAFVHGGPFANLAHGCNSVMATRAATKLGDIVVTEAGFGADLGAEKFIDIKCRVTGLAPAAAVVVTTLRSLKYQGGVAAPDVMKPDAAALERGLANLERHLLNLRDVFGVRSVVGINAFQGDPQDEVELVRRRCAQLEVPVVPARHFAQGGAGAEDLAREVLRIVDDETGRTPLRFAYRLDETLWDKLEHVARRVHHAIGIEASPAVRKQLADWEREGYGELPVCIAKTPYSFSGDAALRGAASGHTLTIREVRLAAGAGFVVAIIGDLLTMPGLPKAPASAGITTDEHGTICGLY